MEKAEYPGDGSVRIALARREGLTLYAVADEADAPLLEPYGWFADVAPHTTYAIAMLSRSLAERRRSVAMHRLIMGHPPQDVDHVDGDGLNNRRSNLRVGTRSQNLANMRPRGGASRYKGVTLHRKSGLWRVRVAGVQLPGYHHDEEAAARAYDEAASAKWGEFARLNFPGEVLDGVR